MYGLPATMRLSIVHVVDDLVITSAGEEIRSRDAFEQWIREFQTRVAALEFEIIESFQNAEGTRVASRWRVRGAITASLDFLPMSGLLK